MSDRIKINKEELTFYLYGDIGPSWLNMVSAEEVVPVVDSFTGKTVNVRINSPGGDIDQGLALYNALARCKAQVNVYVDGLAASAASLVAMSGDNIEMAANSLLMIHRAWTVVAGNSGDMQDTIKVLNRIDDVLAKTYSGRSGKSVYEVARLMDAETWYTAGEAVSAGFADKVSHHYANSIATVAQGRFRNCPKSLIDSSKKAPQPFGADFRTIAEPPRKRYSVEIAKANEMKVRADGPAIAI